RSQTPFPARGCGFESHLRHQAHTEKGPDTFVRPFVVSAVRLASAIALVDVEFLAADRVLDTPRVFGLRLGDLDLLDRPSDLADLDLLLHHGYPDGLSRKGLIAAERASLA